ncbi:PhoU Phosphate uptake regulator [Rhabdaerophilaceae bacterium]
MTNHTVKAFDEELGVLSRKVSEMGGIAEAMLVESIDCLIRNDRVKAEAVVMRDKSLDLLQQEIEDLAVILIAKRQPMANDLRYVMGTVRIAGDIERMGDLFKNIGKRVRGMDNAMVGMRTLASIRSLSQMVQHQLKMVLDSFSQNRPDIARTVWMNDEQIDALHNSLFRELLTYMMEDPRSITYCAHLLFIAKNVERVGDHATNIAETVHLIETGEALTGPRPKSENMNYSLGQNAE